MKSYVMVHIAKGYLETPLDRIDSVILLVGWNDFEIVGQAQYYPDWVKIKGERPIRKTTNLAEILLLCNEITMELMFREDRLRVLDTETKDINCGWCHDWARCLIAMVSGAVHFGYGINEGHGGHSFVQINGLYYDAECHSGVEHWKRLPIFQRIRPEIVETIRDDEVGPI